MSSCLLLRLVRKFRYLDSVFHKLVISQINFINILIKHLTTFIIISIRHMQRKLGLSTFYYIVNHFRAYEQISIQDLNDVLQQKKKDLSCYIGLLNILYNLTLELKKKGKQQEKQFFIKIKKSDKLYTERNIGNILFIRGQILKQYGKFLNTIFYKPANHLVQFNYEQFNKFCNDHGLSQLVRHTRGIYPVIDSNIHKPLQFLSLYKEFQPNARILIGNPSWQLARKTIKRYYQQEINVIEGEMEDEYDINILNISAYLQQQGVNNKESIKNNYDEDVKNGVRLSYILLTQQYLQLQQSINQFQKKYVQNNQAPANNIKKNKQMLDRLRFWFDNYHQFIRQGLQMYLSPNPITKLPPIIYNMKSNYFEDTIIYLIEKIFNIITNKDQKELNQQTKVEIQQKLNKLTEKVTDDSIIQKNIDKMFVLSYIHVIYKIIFSNQQAYDNSKSIYIKLRTNDPMQQPYNRIFYNDKQLLKLYQDGCITSFPTCYAYSQQITKQILRLLIKKNPQNLLKYFEKIKLMDQFERLSMILKSKLIGDISKIKQNGQKLCMGQNLLIQLQKMQNQYKKILRKQQGTYLNTDENIFQDFIESWRKYYKFIRQYNEDYLKQFLKKSKNLLSNKINKQLINNNKRDYLIPSDFVTPYRRKDCYYYFISKFITQIQSLTQLLNTILQEQDPSKNPNFNNIIQKLTRYLKIMTSPQFKYILAYADNTQNSKPNQSQMEQNQVNEKENFEDDVWKVYASVYLLLNEYSKKLTSKVQQKKPLFPTRSTPFTHNSSFPKQSGNYFQPQRNNQPSEIDLEDD